jgi:hypothetical protein
VTMQNRGGLTHACIQDTRPSNVNDNSVTYVFHGKLLFTLMYKLTVGSCNSIFSNESIPCGGGFEYLHRSPASRRRRRKGNSIAGVITMPPCSWEIQTQGPGRPDWGSLESERVKCGYDCAGEDQQQL